MEPSSSKSVPKTKILKKKNKGHWVEKVVEAMALGRKSSRGNDRETDCSNC